MVTSEHALSLVSEATVPSARPHSQSVVNAVGSWVVAFCVPSLSLDFLHLWFSPHNAPTLSSFGITCCPDP